MMNVLENFCKNNEEKLISKKSGKSSICRYQTLSIRFRDNSIRFTTPQGFGLGEFFSCVFLRIDMIEYTIYKVLEGQSWNKLF